MTSKLTSKLASGAGPMLIGACLTLGMSLELTSGLAAEELRIGFIAPMTGPFAQVGKDMVNGFEMYTNEVKGDLGGATVKFILEDDQAKPPTGVLKAEKLIRQDKVHMLIGGVLASTGYALAPVSTREKVVYLPSVPAADDLTQRDSAKYPYVVRTGWTSSQPSHPFGQWACEQGYKKIAAIAADYAFGHEVVGGFQKSFEDCGGKIIQKIWPPLGTIDFGPFIPTLKSDADTIFTLMVGPMSLQFPKQLAAAGNKKPVIGGGTGYDEFVLPSMGDEVMKKTGGKWPGPEEFVKIMASLKVDTPRGQVSIGEFRNPIQNIYIKKVERKKMFGYPNEELWNTVIKTYPNVSQFGQYNKDEFLKQPVYSRDFPACKYCE